MNANKPEYLSAEGLQKLKAELEEAGGEVEVVLLVSLERGEQRLVDAATRQLGTLPYAHTFAHRSTEPVIELDGGDL